MDEQKISVRVPRQDDWLNAGHDLITKRSAPPLVLAILVMFLLTGSIAYAAFGALVTSYTAALWARLLIEPEPDEKPVEA